MVREHHRVYSINRNHSAVRAVTRAYPDKSPELTALLRLFEETVPAEQIWLDTAEHRLITLYTLAATRCDAEELSRQCRKLNWVE